MLISITFTILDDFFIIPASTWIHNRHKEKRGKYKYWTYTCKREKLEFVKMKELLDSIWGTFKGLSKKVCEKVKYLGLNPFNRGGRLRVINGLLGFPSSMKRLLHTIDTCERVRPFWCPEVKSSLLELNVSSFFIFLQLFEDFPQLTYELPHWHLDTYSRVARILGISLTHEGLAFCIRESPHTWGTHSDKKNKD